MSALVIPDDLLLIAGRQFRYCNFASRVAKDENGLYHRPIEMKPKEECNLWSSQCRMDPTKHLPCFDVDVHPSIPLVPSPSTKDHPTVGEYVAALFPEKEARWVPSTTEGHFHVYIDYPYIWGAYVTRLRVMSYTPVVPWNAEYPIFVVQPNYVRYSIANGASHVRMPHIKKDYQADAALWDERGVKSPF